MALIGNYSVLNKNPGRAFGGSTVSDTRAESVKNGPARGRFTSFDQKAGTPNGYLHPGSWIMPQKSGGMSSYTRILGEGAAAAGIAGGKNAVATLTGSGDITNATAALIVSAIATLTGTGALAGNANALLQAVAELAGTGSLAATRSALANAVATLTGSGAMAPTIRATGELAADLTPFTDLSPQTLAAAVWSSAQGSFLYAVAHNRVVTDPSAGTFTVYADDDVTVLYVADLWQDAAGTTPYAGSGAERRDRITEVGGGRGYRLWRPRASRRGCASSSGPRRDDDRHERDSGNARGIFHTLGQPDRRQHTNAATGHGRRRGLVSTVTAAEAGAATDHGHSRGHLRETRGARLPGR